MKGLAPKYVIGDVMLLGDEPLECVGGSELWLGAFGAAGERPRLAACQLLQPWVFEYDDWSRSLLEWRSLVRGALACPAAPEHVGAWEFELGGRRAVALADEYAGDVRLPEALGALGPPVGVGPRGLSLALALGVALPVASVHAAAEALSLGEPVRLGLQAADVYFGWDGLVRFVVEPLPSPRSLSSTTGVGVLKNTFEYLAPEQLHGEAAHDTSAVWSLGVLLFELLAGAHPFRAESALVTLEAALKAPVPPLASRRGDLPGPVAELVDACLRRAPSERPGLAWVVGRLEEAALGAGEYPAGEVARRLASALPGRRRAAEERDEALARADLGELRARGHWLTVTPLVASRPGARRAPAPTARRAAYESGARPELGPRDAAEARAADLVGADGRAMLRARPGLFVDLRPVSNGAYAAFVRATGRPPPADWRGGAPPGAADEPVTGLSHDDASAYARWAEKRLPTDDEWQLAVGAAGGALRGLGLVWEWTSSGVEGFGHVARGGRYRDRPNEPPAPANRTYARTPARDVGFRCVAGGGGGYRDAPAR